MDRDEFMELVYETFADEPDNVLANGIIEAADTYVEQEKAQLFKEGTTSDLISRTETVERLRGVIDVTVPITDYDGGYVDGVEVGISTVSTMPTIQPEVLACGNGELVAQPEPTDIDAREAVYNLAEKIGIHQLFALTVELRGEPIQPEPQWIPVGERLPEDGTWNIFTDGKNISVERYKEDAIDHFFPAGRWFQLEDVLAWMPLPEPYKPNK